MPLFKNNKRCYTHNNKVTLVKGGSNYFSLLNKLIDKAEHSIFIRMYIWEADNTGITIADYLTEASKRGVKVFIIADGYASQHLSKAFLQNLTKSGIKFKFFEPLFKSTNFYFGRRMHEKVVVVDAKYALVGGINFADRYNDTDSKQGWLDFALLVEGDAAYDLYNYCFSEWKIEKITSPALSAFDIEEKCSVRISINDWVKGKHQIWKTYFDLFNKARHSITIICSYFLPGHILRYRLGVAAKRGIKIKIILAGPCDIMLAKHAERYLYPWMLKNGIEIYEYQPTVLHAKMIVVDNKWVTIGSFNINNVSSYASKELNLDVRNKPFAKTIQILMDSIIEKDCMQVTQNNYIIYSSLFKRFIQKTSYEIIRLILNLTTFYFKPK